MSTVIIASINYQVRLGTRRAQMHIGLKLTSGLLTCFFIVVEANGLESCSRGWFGKDCKFICQCAKSVICGREGECPQYGQCNVGYFGPACQYEDLVMTKGDEKNEQYIKDGNDSTCNENPHVDTIVVSFKGPIPFLWIRILVKSDQNNLNFTIELNDQEMCINERRFSVGNNILDITCDNDNSLQKIVLHGPITHEVCSIRVSGGRNVALRQTVMQYPEMPGNLNQPKNAVDGNTNNVYEAGSCTLSSGETEQPRWSLQFLKPHIVLRATIYNRNSNMKRLNGFKFETFNRNLQKTNSFLNSDVNDSISTYNVVLASLEPIMMVNITAASSYLTMCEVQLFGDAVCPEGFYGLYCDQVCQCTPDQVCHIVSGACAPGCPQGKYGFNCSRPCPAACYQNQCLALEGSCKSCFPGFMGGFCNETCQKGSYGHECRMKCSDKCQDVCNSQNGACKCVKHYSGLDCKDKVCPDGMYGINCSQNCSEKCLERQCLSSTGDCIKCYGYREGKFCEDCPAKSFGHLCQTSCSAYCLNETCHKDTGNCPSCTNGYYGAQCSISPDEKLQMYWYIAILVPILIIACLVLTFFYERKRRFSYDDEDEDGR